MYSEDSWEFEREGYRFRANVYRDEDAREPWNEGDGHCFVSEWTRAPKAPGERVLVEDRESRRLYDYAGAIKTALKDGWGPRDAKPGETKRQHAARAVEQDFARMKAWCEDEWWWVGVTVTLLAADGEETNEDESLWGIESDAGNFYLHDVGNELADEIIGRLSGAATLTTVLKKEGSA